MINFNELRAFTGVWIPKEVWLCPKLSPLDKFIFGEISSLDFDSTGCIASNEYLAKVCQCSARKVQDSVSILIKLGFIERVSFDGRRRTLRVAKSYWSSTQKATTYKEDKSSSNRYKYNNKNRNNVVANEPEWLKENWAHFLESVEDL